MAPQTCFITTPQNHLLSPVLRFFLKNSVTVVVQILVSSVLTLFSILISEEHNASIFRVTELRPGRALWRHYSLMTTLRSNHIRWLDILVIYIERIEHFLWVLQWKLYTMRNGPVIWLLTSHSHSYQGYLFSEVCWFIEIDDITTVLVIKVLFFTNLYETLHYDRTKAKHI
jgi:hypothetical protein